MKPPRAALALVIALAAGAARAEAPALEHVRVFADLDDDDDDGLADAAGDALSKVAQKQVHWLVGSMVQPRLTGQSVRVSALGPGFGLQGVRAGRSEVAFGKRHLTVDVVEVRALDGRGRAVDLATSHASITRSLPSSLAGAADVDPDAISWLFIGAPDALPESARITSTRPDGSPLDELSAVELVAHPCPAGVAGEFVCRGTPPIRATSDAVDRGHPESRARSLQAEVGGRLVLFADGKKAVQIRVGGPAESALGPLSRFRGRLRVRILRNAVGGSPALGGSATEAVRLAMLEVDTASQIWGQCGIHFGVGRELDVKVVDPPPARLLSVGCDFGVPASGGRVAFAVGKRQFSMETAAGETPLVIAERLSELLRKAKLDARVSQNPRISAGALGSVDVELASGTQAFESDGSSPLSTDPTLGVCIAAVDLRDGLTHFGDADSGAGTLEERALLKAFDDGDPSTIEVYIVPAFAESARIGESFIYTPGSRIENAVIIDRAAIRAGARSYALAHELGHILLEMPGHPDDFGVDQPSLLMDADAADPTIFGPRRLTVPECERALRQSGPSAPVPLLREWPLFARR